MPLWVARLPHKIGYPAGGSLTADEWKCLGMVFGPAVVSTPSFAPRRRLKLLLYEIPLVWHEHLAEALEEFGRPPTEAALEKKAEKRETLWAQHTKRVTKCEELCATKTRVYTRKKEARKKRRDRGHEVLTEPEPDMPEEPIWTEPVERNVPRMQEGEQLAFLKLATALKILMGRRISEADLTRAQELMEAYLSDLYKVFITFQHQFITNITFELL